METGRSLEGKALRGEYHEAWAELAGATFANVTQETSSSSSGLSFESAYITQNFWCAKIDDFDGLM